MATSMTTDLVSTEQSQTTAQHAKRESERGSWIITLSGLYARVALGAGFLASVADRFGLWGAYGRPNVSWGNFQNFVQYTGMVNSFLPSSMIPPLAWAATRRRVRRSKSRPPRPCDSARARGSRKASKTTQAVWDSEGPRITRGSFFGDDRDRQSSTESVNFGTRTFAWGRS